QEGFSAVEALPLVILVALIGVSGWFVYNNHRKTTTTKSSSVSNIQSSNQSNTYAGWKTYSWTAEGLTFKYPSSWVTINPQVSPSLQSPYR
ncbi:MAG TPA: hypothetical protein VGS11_09005, partial [Candidatus Bathyarchaeia archaeon]|nr:hypothetical protein [Candidatus Bathyarchaeia archaeon]